MTFERLVFHPVPTYCLGLTALGNTVKRTEGVLETPGLMTLELRGVPAKERPRVRTIHRYDEIGKNVVQCLGRWNEHSLVLDQLHGLDETPDMRAGIRNIENGAV